MRRRTLHVTRALRLGILLSVAGAACTGPSTPPSKPSATPSALECKAQGYPCTLAEVPPAILQRGDALSDQVRSRLDGGGSTAETMTWLKEQKGMAEVEADEQAVRFRLEGGRGVWVMTDEAFAPSGGGAALTGASGGAGGGSAATLNGGFLGSGAISTAALRGLFGRLDLTPPGLPYVVGPDAEEKQALVLSPFLWDFGADDEGASVAKILDKTRGYANSVTYRANPTKTGTDVGVQSFMGWRGYDVVHVSSHGTRLCDPGCRAMIVSGETGLLAAMAEHTEPGLELLKGPRTGLTYLVLSADFFRSAYPGGLDNTIVFFDACETYGIQATDLADAIRGTTSVFLGWSAPVNAPVAKAASIKWYSVLSESGLTTEEAYADLGNMKSDPDSPAVLTLSRRDAGGDLRLREVVALMQPDTGQILSSSDTVAIEGTPRDGKPDAVPYLVQVDGVKPSEASSVLLHVSVDGVKAELKPVSTGKENDKGQWMVSGLFPLQHDLEAEKVVTFRAWVDLPSGGTSRHQTPATITGEIPIMGLVWELKSTNVTVKPGGGNARITATAHMTLGFAPGQDVKETHPRYVVTGGMVTWSIGGTDASGCTFKAPPVSIDLTSDRTASGSSFLAFDTTASPVQYTGLISATGSGLVATKTCPDPSSNGEVDFPANSIFLRVDQDEPGTVTTGTTISGTRHEGTYFSYQVSWTVTRIK